MVRLDFPKYSVRYVVISSSREEGGLRAPALSDPKTEYSAIEAERSLEIGHFEVNMPDTDRRIRGRLPACLFLSLAFGKESDQYTEFLEVVKARAA